MPKHRIDALFQKASEQGWADNSEFVRGGIVAQHSLDEGEHFAFVVERTDGSIQWQVGRWDRACPTQRGHATTMGGAKEQAVAVLSGMMGSLF